jgi:hypothetical protein
MRISEHYRLGRTQATLDFVDVDVRGDTRVFISPRALMQLPSEWGDECVHLVQNFFQTVLELIRAGDNDRAETLLRVLREPNETHLGLSAGRSKGHALGNESARDVWKALSQSEAAKSGLLQDLEDTVLMVEGISTDIVSDITTNIIRGPLIRYTQQMCEMYAIPVEEGVASGPLWDAENRRWFTRFERLPIARNNKLLLVPKAIVRRHLEYDADEYYRHFLLEHLQAVELDANSSLVELLKDGRRRVTKKALMEKYGTGKRTIVRETLKHPEVLTRYKTFKRGREHLPLTHEDLADVERQAGPDWDQLISSVTELEPGKADSDKYENFVEGLLTALFYPALTNPVVQHEIHDGRKRIDITYTNMATAGFFKWLAAHYAAAHVFVECKNYGREIGNPELDQLSSRFSPTRGQFGLLVCRQFADKALFLQRCRDTSLDGRGFVIPVDDEDLRGLVQSRQTDALFLNLRLFQDRFRGIVS